MPKVSWSSDVQQRVRRLLQELLSYVLDYRDDLQLRYRWEHEDSDRPKLIVETKRRFLVELAEFEIQSHFYEAIKRLEDLNIYEDRRFHKRGTDYWHFALRLWSKDKQKNLREFDREWEQKRPQKSKQLENNKPKPQISKVSPFRYNNIPESGVVEFVGRSDELKKLYQQFQQTDRIAISAIAGMGGVGKTELAIQYARQHFENLERKNCSGGVCWLLARDSNLSLKVVQFTKSHFPNFTLPDGLTPEAQVEFCWQNWQEGDVLVVLDDVTDYNQIKSYLPPKSFQFKVLITTREKLQPPIVRLDLDVLKPQAALDLFASLIKTGPERMQQKADIVVKLCEWLGYLPLGLELVGRYLLG
ncbi:MAG: NB-ARC domain-containing protein, partial [Tolypothrix sp. T3-bin4]|nr:NB-ARC domain-containing protein [Tolypothrix sp. T3-bin4]